MGGINGGGLGTRLLLFLVLETPCNYARRWHISNTSSNQNIVQTHQCIGHYRFTLKHKNDTITILLHVNVSKQVESKLEIQEAPLTCTELNAEALGSSVRGKLVCMSIIIAVILNSLKGVG